jgi:hypothetical protein
MPRNVIPLPEWIPNACELMVKYDLSLRQAAAELGKDISIEEAETLKDRKLFKEQLEQARLANYAEIGSSSLLTKEAVVGQIYKLAARLAADHEDYKAADAYLKLAKTAGFVGAEAPPSVLSTLTQSKLDEVRQRIRQMKQTEEPQPAEAQQPDRAGEIKQVN